MLRILVIFMHSIRLVCVIQVEKITERTVVAVPSLARVIVVHNHILKPHDCV